MTRLALVLACLALVPLVARPAEDLAAWRPLPADFKPTARETGSATLQATPWSYLVAPADSTDIEVATTVVIDGPATRFDYFGSSWSVWPDPKVADMGFEAALLLRGREDGSAGYRVQVSLKYQEVALVRFPDGGYVASVPCALPAKKPLRLRARANGGAIRVFVDDKELIRHADRLAPVPARGRIGIGVSSGARVTFSATEARAVEPEAVPAATPHQPNFTVRKWIGGRQWVFDGDEPILLLPSPESSTVMNVKLLPGFKPLLTWNSHWDTQNQGAYPEAANSTVDVRATGGGASLTATWKGKHTGNRFATETKMVVGFDRQRGTYTYDIDSELEVFPGQPFHFRYGFDFEHHTPLDPFNWQYLVARRRGGELYHRPVAPTDPGPQHDLETYHGLRVWHGRHNGDMRVAPAVEYEIRPEWNEVEQGGKPGRRQCNTAVCAAFYDTGVAFAPETAKPGTKIRVKYRYAGYPAEEAKGLFDQSKVYAAPTLDPKHHYIFADEWPKLTFSQFTPLSQTWQLGRSPFMSGHNQRPSYGLEKNCGVGSGFAMRLGPASYGKATLAKAGSPEPGRYILTAMVKSDNAIGPGGRIELKAAQAKTNKELSAETHFVGAGSFGWQRQGFSFEVPPGTGSLAIAFGNAGTGDFLVTDVEIRKLAEGEDLPAGVLSKANARPTPLPPAPPGAVADFRMLEGKGFHSLNHAGGAHLELANLAWVVDGGRPALRFADNESGREEFQPDGHIGMNIFGNAQDFNYLGAYKAYEGRRGVPFAMGAGGGIVLGCERYYLHAAYYRGLIGRVVILRHALGDNEVSLLARDQPLPDAAVPADSKGVTIAAWVKPAPRLGNNNMHPGGGDIVGYGNRNFVLKLMGSGERGESSPYRLAARLDVNDGIQTGPVVLAQKWHHVALTVIPENGKRRMRLFVDGKPAADGLTAK